MGLGMGWRHVVGGVALLAFLVAVYFAVLALGGAL